MRYLVQVYISGPARSSMTTQMVPPRPFMLSKVICLKHEWSESQIDAKFCHPEVPLPKGKMTFQVAVL